jgi:hypothetical protein
VGTQLLLCNPLCTVAYAYAAWTFFAGRIPYEEALLEEFYGTEYVQYARSTVMGIRGFGGHIRRAVMFKAAARWLRGRRDHTSRSSSGNDSSAGSGDSGQVMHGEGSNTATAGEERKDK